MITTQFIKLFLATIIVTKIAFAQPPITKPKIKQVVSPRALITQVEIAEYRHAIKVAPTYEAKMAIREATYARLRQRATERGMIMSEPHPWFGGLHWGEIAPLQIKQEPKPVVIQAKPATSQHVTPHPTKPVTTMATVPHPATAKPSVVHPTKPVVLPKPISPHHTIPIMLPHPIKL
jgi:hypothetical protein